MDWQTILYNTVVPKHRRRRFIQSLERRFSCDTWGTNDGRIIPMNLMRDSHLDNAVRYTMRQADGAMFRSDYDLYMRYCVNLFALSDEALRRGKHYPVIERYRTEYDEMDDALREDEADGFYSGAPNAWPPRNPFDLTEF